MLLCSNSPERMYNKNFFLLSYLKLLIYCWIITGELPRSKSNMIFREKNVQFLSLDERWSDNARELKAQLGHPYPNPVRQSWGAALPMLSRAHSV